MKLRLARFAGMGRTIPQDYRYVNGVPVREERMIMAAGDSMGAEGQHGFPAPMR
jgi:hypothetical protein